MIGDLKVVVGRRRLPPVGEHRNQLHFSTVTTLAKFLRDAGLSWSARGSIEDATSNGDYAAFVGRSMGIDGARVSQQLWDAGALLTRDPYTDAAKGTVHLTMTLVVGFWDSPDLELPTAQICDLTHGRSRTSCGAR